MQDHSKMAETINNLPSHYYDQFSDNFVIVLAALRLHSFTILRADEGIAENTKELWQELSHPSILLHSPATIPLRDKMRKTQPGSPDHTAYSNKIIQANLREQSRLLALLAEFYEKYTPPFYSRLIAETVELGDTYLRSQGASVTVLEKKTQRERDIQNNQKELQRFAEFLVSKI